MISDSELNAMVYLLDDDDETVIQEVETKLFEYAPGIIPQLEDYLLKEKNPLRVSRLEKILDKHTWDSLYTDTQKWVEDGAQDLLQGIHLIIRTQYPNYRLELLVQHTEQLAFEVWLNTHNAFHPQDKIAHLNFVLFEKHGYQGNNENYYHIDNSYLNKVIEKKEGNPISLSILYILVAHRLNLPIYGVNLPQHFVVGYCVEKEPAKTELQHDKSVLLDRNKFGEVDFYINTFNKGQLLQRHHIEEFLRQHKTQALPQYFETCNNAEIFLRVLRNICTALEQNKEEIKLNKIQNYMDFFQGLV